MRLATQKCEDAGYAILHLQNTATGTYTSLSTFQTSIWLASQNILAASCEFDDEFHNISKKGRKGVPEMSPLL